MASEVELDVLLDVLFEKLVELFTLEDQLIAFSAAAERRPPVTKSVVGPHESASRAIVAGETVALI